MVISWIVLLIAIAGLVIYLLASNPKAARIGEIMLLCGLLATCLLFGGHTVRLP